jgi:hypothetical protein
MSNFMTRWLVSSGRWSPAGQAPPEEAAAISHHRRGVRRSVVTSWLGPFQGKAVSVLRPMVWFSVIVLFLLGVIVLLLLAAPGLVDSIGQRVLHRTSVHDDSTSVQPGKGPALKTRIIFVYRDINGTVHRVLADETDAKKFINDTLEYLDTERKSIKEEVQRQITALLETTFSDRQEAIKQFADWYFAWGQTWRLLYVSILGGANGARISDVQGILEGSHNAVEAYLIETYQRLVLKPELRNPGMDAGISQILADAHARYIRVLTTMEDRAQVFLSQHTRHLDVLHPEDKVRMSLDWDAQKWKARYLVGDDTLNAGLRAMTLVGASTLLAKELGLTIDRALVEIFRVPARRVVTAMTPQIVGTVTGTAVEPGLGTLGGWLIGLGSATAFDYLSNKYHEHVDRAEFERISGQGLNVTMDEWSRAISRDLFKAVDAWFDDTRTVVAEQQIHKN